MSEWRDLVFVGDRLVGDFNGVYRDELDPWGQGAVETALSPSRWFTMRNIRKHKLTSVVDVGCGHGHLAHAISTQTPAWVAAYDISGLAINQARLRFGASSRLQFIEGDFTDALYRHMDLDAVLLSEITWYLLPRWEELLNTLERQWKGKYLLHNLSFYSGNKQKYGREFFTTPREFIERCPWTLVEYMESMLPCGDTETSMMFRI